MRISTLQTYTNAIDQMQRGQTKLAETQQRIASGKELLRPSDDPVAAAQILKLNREVARIDKFEQNIEVTDRRLQLEEMTLDQVNTASDRLKELTIQAGGGVLTDADRGFIADEVRQLQKQILGLMNTKDTAGEYLFSGSKGFTPPFVQNSDGSFDYEGDDGQRFIQVGPELRIASTDSGRDIFQVIPGDMQVRALGADTSVVSKLSVIDRTATTFANFTGGKGGSGDITVSISKNGAVAGEYRYTVRDSAGNVLTGDSPEEPLENIAFTAGDADEGVVELGGITFEVRGLTEIGIEATALKPVKMSGATAATSDATVTNPADYKTFTETNGDVLLTFDKTVTPNTFTVTRVSDTADLTPLDNEISSEGTIAFAGIALTDLSIAHNDTLVLRAEVDVTLRAEQKNHSILQTAEDLINALEIPLNSTEKRQEYQAALAKVHEELNIAKEGNLRVRTQLGARMNSVEAAGGANADFKLFTETALSQLQDLDYARAISEFSLQEMALQASQATFTRISKLSLFDFL